MIRFVGGLTLNIAAWFNHSLIRYQWCTAKRNTNRLASASCIAYRITLSSRPVDNLMDLALTAFQDAQSREVIEVSPSVDIHPTAWRG